MQICFPLQELLELCIKALLLRLQALLASIELCLLLLSAVAERLLCRRERAGEAAVVLGVLPVRGDFREGRTQAD